MFKKSYKGRRVKAVAKKSLKLPITIVTSLTLVIVVVISTIINKGLVNVFSDSVTASSTASSVASESTADLVQSTSIDSTKENTEETGLESESVEQGFRGALTVSSDVSISVTATPEEKQTVNSETRSTATTSSSLVLSNGNTAGATGSYAAAQMAAATGVSQATWEAIIARESNGDHTAANGSGASGLFQTMPGWGSTATVEDQIQSALNAYNAQGLSAWNY